MSSGKNQQPIIQEQIIKPEISKKTEGSTMNDATGIASPFDQTAKTQRRCDEHDDGKDSGKNYY